MKKLVLIALATAALAGCREANTGVQSRPTAAGPAPDKTLRLDTTFVKATPGLRTYPHTYAGSLLVGEGRQVAVPLEINWTTVEQAGCAQVASVRVYQLNAADRRTKVSVRALRDAVCRPGPQPDGTPGPYTGAAYLKLTAEARDVHRLTSTSFALNGLGYHDTLPGDAARPQ